MTPTTDFSRPVLCVLGLPFDIVDLAGAEQVMRSAIADRRRMFLSTPNINFLIACQTDAAFRESVIDSDLSVADGMPIIWLSRLVGTPLPERVAGSTLFERLCGDAARPVSVYLFGGPDGIAAKAAAAMSARCPGGRCVGARSPGFGTVAQMSPPEVLAEINASKADFLLVALGAKKGQEWIVRNLAALDAPAISHLGAVINFLAGTVSRAPLLAQKLGLEWIWRIKEEPKLWQRYWKDGVALLGMLTRFALPLALAQRRRGAAVPATLDVRGRRLTLGGDWSATEAPKLGAAFTLLAAAPGPVEIDLSGVRWIDGHAIGKLLLLRAHQKRAGQPLNITARGPARRLIELHAAGYLLAADSAQPAGAAARLPL
ncbi:WecB/TagA/CpsF family glycosyltransferase [Derxia lacustris]|uniref:WecB/TagA/CpsF family glycosyltransferase n=1 Tax=Derxia lacustris TaxID=764842 RepID=UPI000A175A49|nr:WecB/TagA/CpsF family glycosyltransferase [Derxia lacustris]